MSSNTVKRITHNGGLAVLTKTVKTPGTVSVGIIDAGDHPSGDYTVAGIGYLHEYGGEKVPERSFIRSTLHAKKKQIIALQVKLLRKILNNTMDTKTALGLIGEYVSDEIKQKIVSLRTPPNKPATIRIKGSSNPLVDTGQLKSSITYEVNI